MVKTETIAPPQLRPCGHNGHCTAPYTPCARTPAPPAAARGLFRMPPPRLANRYFLVRTGDSVYVWQGVHTNPVAKSSVDSGLSPAGLRQTARSSSSASARERVITGYGRPSRSAPTRRPRSSRLPTASSAGAWLCPGFQFLQSRFVISYGY
jgi:hypothetical protein